MANPISPELLAQLYGQESNDPFLSLLTLSHTSFSDIRLVNNTSDVTSRSLLYTGFPFKLSLPFDDGESAREISIVFDNVGLDLINDIRTVTDFIDVKLELVLSSIPDEVQLSYQELKINNITYSATQITARLFLDGFLNTELSSEKYLPTNFPGLF